MEFYNPWKTPLLKFLYLAVSIWSDNASDGSVFASRNGTEALNVTHQLMNFEYNNILV